MLNVSWSRSSSSSSPMGIGSLPAVMWTGPCDLFPLLPDLASPPLGFTRTNYTHDTMSQDGGSPVTQLTTSTLLLLAAAKPGHCSYNFPPKISNCWAAMALFSFMSSMREQGEVRANSLDMNTIFTLMGRNQCWRLGREVKIKSISPLQRTELRVVSYLQASAILCHITSSQIMACSCTSLPIWLTCSQSHTKNLWKANFPLLRQQNFLVCTYDLSVKTHWACSTYLFLGQVLQVIIMEAFTPLPICTQPQGSCTQNSRDIWISSIPVMLKHSFCWVLNSDNDNLQSWWCGHLGHLGEFKLKGNTNKDLPTLW